LAIAIAKRVNAFPVNDHAHTTWSFTSPIAAHGVGVPQRTVLRFCSKAGGYRPSLNDDQQGAETMTWDIPTLKSSRLTLRAIRADDLGHLVAMSQDSEITKYLHEGPAPPESVVWQRMSMALGQWALRGYGMMVVDDRDGFVGRLGVHHPYDAPEPQIGYIFCKRGWGQGYATEGVGLIVDWMFRTHHPQRLISEIARENTASARVASKLGAALETTIKRDNILFDIWTYPKPG
jgi:RimJ/RimL family protein N-acetyltransferase